MGMNDSGNREVSQGLPYHPRHESCLVGWEQEGDVAGFRLGFGSEEDGACLWFRCGCLGKMRSQM